MKDLRFIHIKDNAELSEELRQKVNEFIAAGEKFNEEHLPHRTVKTEYNKLKAKKDNSWSSVFKPFFAEFSHSRCPICEQIIDKYDDIEHYRPKEKYWWLAYDYKNYYAVCSLCNRHFKGTDFPIFNPENKIEFDNRHLIENEQPLLFNPTTDNPLELFELEFYFETNNKYKLLIKPSSKLDRNSYLYQKAETTIRFYNLNNAEIQENPQDNFSRKELIDSLYRELFDVANTQVQFNKLDKSLEKEILFREYANLRAKYKNIESIGLSALIRYGNFTSFDKMKVVY